MWMRDELLNVGLELHLVKLLSEFAERSVENRSIEVSSIQESLRDRLPILNLYGYPAINHNVLPRNRLAQHQRLYLLSHILRRRQSLERSLVGRRLDFLWRKPIPPVITQTSAPSSIPRHRDSQRKSNKGTVDLPLSHHQPRTNTITPHPSLSPTYRSQPLH
jgi:hypothetical protein